MDAPPRSGTVRIIAVAIVLLAAVAWRTLGFAPNFTPLGAALLLAGYVLGVKRALWLALPALVISDLLLGSHPMMAVVWVALGLYVVLGRFATTKTSPLWAAAGAGSFFVITNFAVWAMGTMYPMTAGGLIACYAAAIPFALNQFAADIVFATGLFAAWSLAEHRAVAVRQGRAPAAVA